MSKLKQRVKFAWQKLTRGWSDDETWVLNWEFVRWINTRSKRYLELAGELVDLGYYKFTYKGKKYTQSELIKKMIELSDEYLDEDKGCDLERDFELENEIAKIWSMLISCMWW